MKRIFLVLSILCGGMSSASASKVELRPWNGDADLKKVFADQVATHAVCIAKTKGTRSVAGLSFEKKVERNAWRGTPRSGSYRLWNLDQLFGGKNSATTHVGGTGAGLLEEFLYTQKGKVVRLELGGLVPEKPYRLIIFTQGWEPEPNKRIQLVSSSTDTITEVVESRMKVIEPNRFGKRAGALVVVDYMADQKGCFEIVFDPLDDVMSLHLAAFANFERN